MGPFTPVNMVDILPDLLDNGNRIIGEKFRLTWYNRVLYGKNPYIQELSSHRRRRGG